jgi:Tfp pilus assembly protein PilO
MTALYKHLVLLVLFSLLAGASWVVAWYANASLSAMRDAKVAARAAVQQEMRDNASAALLHSAVEESTDMRTQLERVASADVVSLATAITQAATAAGAVVRVTDVGPVPDIDVGRAKQTGVHTVGYSVEATGTFAQLASVVALLETLPAPSSVDQFTLARVSGGNGWRLSVRLRVLTAVSAT